MTEEPTLSRSLSLPLLVLYGLGTTIGAGIYVLIGLVAERAGFHAPISFAVASILAAFTALSFAELSARFPRSAGEAVYVREGLGRPGLATLVGLLVVSSGCVSAAAMASGFVGYLGELVRVPGAISIPVMVMGLGALAAWGVSESVRVASIVTVIEIAGLLAVLAAAAHAVEDPWVRLGALAPPSSVSSWWGIFGGSLLAFYAFLGFEDMVNVAEEVKRVRRALPIAICVTLGVTTLIYVAISAAAVLAVSPDRLASSAVPLATLWEDTTGRGSGGISAISVIALLNGALIQIIMAARILYGLARQGSLPAALGRVHPRTRTPLLATGIVVVGVIGLALWIPLGKLAEGTSVLTLLVFALVNLSLTRIKARSGPPEGGLQVPRWVPWCGFAVSVGFVTFWVVEKWPWLEIG